MRIKYRNLSEIAIEMTSWMKILTCCNIHCLPSPEISHANRQCICNILNSRPLKFQTVLNSRPLKFQTVLNSRPFLPLNLSRQFLSQIYSGRNNIFCKNKILFLPHEIHILNFFQMFLNHRCYITDAHYDVRKFQF